MGRTRSGRMHSWARTNFIQGAAATFRSVDLLAGLSGSLGRQLGPLTVQRIIYSIDLNVESDTTEEINWGIIRVSAEAFAAGEASMPDPQTKLDADWMHWDGAILPSGNNEVAAGVFNSVLAGYLRLEYDIKTGRKIDASNQVLAFIASANGVVIRSSARFQVLILE